MEESVKQKMSELIVILSKYHKTKLSFYYETTDELIKG